MLLVRWVVKWLRHGDEGLYLVAMGALAILGAAFLVWFGLSKIRLRARLGGVATLVGWAEILIVVAGLGMLLCFAATEFSAGRQPLDTFLHQLEQTVLVLCLMGTLTWAFFTALLFGVVRNQIDPEQERA